ncbi:MAG: hypothetical protein IKJ11_10645 [Clostridia bacterium]|nr:hypothetical protein [Clostridia bacterium]
MKVTNNKGSWLGASFFALCVFMTAAYLLAGYGAYLDADMASELALARQLVSEGTLFSSEWYYSTEVRLLNTQLVFTPLMALFGGNWQLVRTIGCMILLIALAASCLFAARMIGAKYPYAWVFSGLTICVGSPLYAQNVIIGAYYVPHAVLAFVMLGLYGGWLQRRKALTAVILLVLSFVMGLSSIRYLLSAIMPLTGAALWQFVFTGEKEEDCRTPEQMQSAGLGLGIGVMGAAGYVIGKKLLPKLFLFNASYHASTGYASFSQHDLSAQIQSVIYGLLYAMGFEESVPLFGAQGILNALVLLEIFVSILLLSRALRRECAPAQRMGMLMLVFAAVLSAMSFVLLRSVYFDRYWLPVLMLGAPVLALCLSTEKNVVLRALAMLLFAGTVLIGSASTMYYSMRNPQLAGEGRLDIVQMADELGLSKGYATFWNANVIDEASDGEVNVVGVEWIMENKEVVGFRPMRWLQTERDFAMDMPDEPVFLLVGEWEMDGIEPLLKRLQARQIEIGGWIRFYLIPSQRLLFEVMQR